MPKDKGRKKAEEEEEDSNLNQRNKMFLKWRLERLIFIQLARLCNKKRDELEKTTALKKIRVQIKLLADEIRLFKDEATRNKEQRKFTDLHTTLVGEGLIAARPLDSGPPRGGDQGKGGGTLGVYGRMYPKLPLCGPDGEYIFPGGLQESRHSDPVICSTPHVPRKGNPSAPPDYANHDAIQIPKQPPEVRPGTVTKNESRIGGFDDNKQPHCSVMGGAATPHMMTKDEKDEIVNLRPLKKIESAEGRTILYEPSSPNDIERWSTEIDHPRRAGLQPWMKLKQLMLLYELHPYDGLAILFKHLSSTERTQIRYEVEDAIGEDGMRPGKGWEAIKAWIQKHSRAQVNWTTITRCMQKEDEGLDQFNERFFECYLLHSGQTEYDMDTIDQSQDLPLKTMYLQQVLPEIRRGVKTRFSRLGQPKQHNGRYQGIRRKGGSR